MERVLFESASRRIRRSGRIVGRSPNPVHSVLYRVVVFVNASIRRFLLQVEFRARILRVVYVGAIAVLFRFVVMMLNLSETTTEAESRGTKKGKGLRRRRGRGGLRGVALMGRRGKGERMQSTRGKRRREAAEKGADGKVAGEGREERRTGTYVEWVKVRDPRRGRAGFGQVLYTDGRRYVVGAGIVLLVAMLGAIVLTLKVRRLASVKRQQVDQQRARDAEKAVRRVKNR